MLEKGSYQAETRVHKSFSRRIPGCGSGTGATPMANRTCVLALIEAVKRECRRHPHRLRGVISAQGLRLLKNAGVSAIYGPGANILQVAAEILSLIQKQRAAA